MPKQMNFFKTFLAAFLAIFAVVIAFIFIVGVGITSAVMSSKDNEKVEVRDKSILHLKLNGEIVESAANEDFDFSKFIPGADVSHKIGLYQAIRAIEAAKKDDNIKGIYIQPDMVFSGGWASLKSLRDAILDFKTSGKFVAAYSQVYTEKSYYLASVADKVYLSPPGIMEI